MEVILNNEKVIIQPCNLLQFMEEKFPELSSGIAVAIGIRVIPRTQWETTPLAENDSITIIRATRGG